MRRKLLFLGITGLLASCTNLKLAIPDSFQQQATMQHVKGAKTRQMSSGLFTTTKIKRGPNISFSGWGRAYLLQNLWLNQLGISKNGIVDNQKAKFHYDIADGKNTLGIYAHEVAVKKETEYTLLNNSISTLDNYNYIFTAVFNGDSNKVGRDWEMVLSNIHDRKTSADKNPFTLINNGDNGMATNGTDTIFIKPLEVKQKIKNDGSTQKLLMPVLAGYELSTSGGVIAVMDLVKKDIWYYKELDDAEKLVVNAISTAILARRVHDQGW